MSNAAEMALFEDIVTLSTLAALADPSSGGRAYLDEAKALVAKTTRPTGDYLVLQHDIARLAVAFAADDPGLVPDGEVADIVRRHDRLSAGWGVLALAGWHARKRGNEELARRAIDTEKAKPARIALSVALPALAAWLDGEAQAVDQKERAATVS